VSSSLVQLGGIVEIVMGQAPPGKECNKDGIGSIFVKAGEFGSKFPVEREWTTKPLRFAKSGDVLVCVVGATAGKINRAIDCAIGRSVAAVQPSLAITTEYLHHFLATQVHLLRERSQGAAQSVITRKMLNELSIPLPPLEEQRRIVEILDAAQGLIDQRKEQIALMDQLVQSLFYTMFGDPVTNPMGWDRMTCVEIGVVQGGLQVTHKRKDLPLEVSYLRVANVFKGYLDLSEIKRIKLTPAEKKRAALMKDDILIVEGHGNPSEVGRCAIWNSTIEECVHQNHLIRLRLNNELVNSGYFVAFWNSIGGRHQLEKLKKTTSGLNTLSANNVRSVVVSLPPLSLQTEFASRVSTIEAQKAAMASSLSELEDTFNALMQRAFKAELGNVES